MAALEWSTASGAGFPTVTLTYTDQDGNTGATATVNGVNTVSAGAFEIFQLAAGDTGVRAPTSIINDATRTSGTVHLVLFRLIAEIDLPLANAGNSLDAMSSGMPQIYNDSVLQLVWFPSATGTTNIVGTYIETQG
jgi:acetyl-CoA acetyltransferase